MDYIVITLVGFVGGGLCVFLALLSKQRQLESERQRQESWADRLREAQDEVRTARHALDERASRLAADTDALGTARTDFDARVISYDELASENALLKTDMQTLLIQARKLQLDDAHRAEQQAALDRRSRELANRYLSENTKAISASLNASNFTSCKQRLTDVVERCRNIGFQIPEEEEAQLVSNLKDEYARAVRAALERDEQARIKAQIREEQLREKEIDRELKQLEREREAIKAALEKALEDANNLHSEEVERLRERLAEAEARSQRAISQAQLTKAGHVYIISNIGSFGEGVFKIGMTRRLEPLERVRELGGASVPFPYDVHMMIACDDAPTLENALHRKLFRTKINKTNPRKEFFRTDIEAIAAIVKENHGEVEYVVDPDALQYRQSLGMPDEDQQYIESVFDDFMDDEAALADDV